MSDKAIQFLPVEIAEIAERLRGMLPLTGSPSVVSASQYVNDVSILLGFVGTLHETLALAHGIEVVGTEVLGSLNP